MFNSSPLDPKVRKALADTIQGIRTQNAYQPSVDLEEKAKLAGAEFRASPVKSQEARSGIFGKHLSTIPNIDSKGREAFIRLAERNAITPPVSKKESLSEAHHYLQVSKKTLDDIPPAASIQAMFARVLTAFNKKTGYSLNHRISLPRLKHDSHEHFQLWKNISFNLHYFFGEKYGNSLHLGCAAIRGQDSDDVRDRAGQRRLGFAVDGVGNTLEELEKDILSKIAKIDSKTVPLHEEVGESLSEATKLPGEAHAQFVTACANIIKAVNTHGKYEFKASGKPTTRPSNTPSETLTAFDKVGGNYELTINCDQDRTGFDITVFLEADNKKRQLGFFRGLSYKGLYPASAIAASDIKSKIKPKKK